MLNICTAERPQKQLDLRQINLKPKAAHCTVDWSMRQWDNPDTTPWLHLSCHQGFGTLPKLNCPPLDQTLSLHPEAQYWSVVPGVQTLSTPHWSCVTCQPATIIPVPPRNQNTTRLNNYRPNAMTSVVMKSFVLSRLQTIVDQLQEPLQVCGRWPSTSSSNTRTDAGTYAIILLVDVLQDKVLGESTRK